MLKTVIAGLFEGIRTAGICSVLALVTGSASARTLLESEDTLYNLNAIGFVHIDLAEFDGDQADNPGIKVNEGFQEARLALHISSRMGQRISAFAEAEVTATEDDVGLEVERVVVKYDLNNTSQISAGRYHAPIGYWNQRYHHGRWLQLSKDRPVQTEFGLNFLPSHFWGAMYERRFQSSKYSVDLDLGVGSRTENFTIPDFAGPVTIGGDEAVMAQVSVSPVKNKNLTFGGSVWVGGLKPSGSFDIDEQVFTVHFDYRLESGEILAEASLVKHDYNDGRGSFDSHGGYIQYSHRLPQAGGRLQPYVRLDYLDIDQGDVVYSGLRSNDRQTLGIRLDLSETTAIKLEVRHDKYPDTNQSVDSLQGQFAAYF